MKKWIILTACCVALAAAFTYGAAEFRTSQNLTVFTSSPSTVWFFAEWDYTDSVERSTGSGVGNTTTVLVNWPYYNRYYGMYFYDYGIGRFYSILYSYWAPI
jgi:hypothetical protein